MENRQQEIRDNVAYALKNPDDNIHLFKKDIDQDGGKIVRFLDKKIGILVGISDGYWDYYFVVYTNDNKIISVSGACKYDILQQEEMDSNPEAQSLLEKQKFLTAFHLQELFDKYCAGDLLIYGFYF